MPVNPYRDPADFAEMIEALGDSPIAYVEDFERSLSANADTWRAGLLSVPAGLHQSEYAAVLVSNYDQELARASDHLRQVRNLLDELRARTV